MANLTINDATNMLFSRIHADLEGHLKADVIYLYGPLLGDLPEACRNVIEELRNPGAYMGALQDDAADQSATELSDTLYVILRTTAGSAEVVERIVNTVRHHYKEVHFVVPDYAYSAGTILCMSGDAIHMDYYSVLGPIDPQVETKEGKLVPALGYLDKVQEMIDRSKNGELTNAEFVILKDMDLAELRDYQQARDLPIDLLKKWLVRYKFANWKTHSSTNKPVTHEEKVERAEAIATALSDSHKWKSHGRPLSINELQDIRLKIDDYSEDTMMHRLVHQYHQLAREYMEINNIPAFLRSRSSGA